jgi:RNA polymerase sporulation-specific sigma factor
MNDYELVYLIQCNQDELAFEYLVLKYHKLIYKIMHAIQVQASDLDDFYQEGIIMLQKAVKTFEERHEKTFTKYFEMIVRRHFYHLRHQAPKYVLQEERFFYQQPALETPQEMIIPEFKNLLDQQVYELYYLKAYKIKEITVMLALPTKRVYNLIYRVKKLIEGVNNVS